MKKYHDSKSVPLKFHKYFTYVHIPLMIVVNILIILVAISNVSIWNISDTNAVSIFIRTLDSIFLVVLIIGLDKKKEYGWIMIIVYTAALMLFSLFKIMSYWPDSPEMFGTEIPMFVLMLSVAAYYTKRKRVFFSSSQENLLSMNSYENNSNEEMRLQEEVANQLILQGSNSYESVDRLTNQGNPQFKRDGVVPLNLQDSSSIEQRKIKAPPFIVYLVLLSAFILVALFLFLNQNVNIMLKLSNAYALREPASR